MVVAFYFRLKLVHFFRRWVAIFTRPEQKVDVDNTNPTLCSADGVLFNKDKTVLILYPCGNSRESYSVPNGVTEIAEYAFSNSTRLKTITIPNSVITLKKFAFGLTGITEISLPDSITTIEEGIFSGCDNLTNVNIGKGIDYLSRSMFFACKNLKSFIIPDHITMIGDDSFGGCNNLSEVVSLNWTRRGYILDK